MRANKITEARPNASSFGFWVTEFRSEDNKISAMITSRSQMPNYIEVSWAPPITGKAKQCDD